MWIPIRTLRYSPPGHTCCASLRCISSTAETQEPGDVNVAKKESPGCFLLSPVRFEAPADDLVVVGENRCVRVVAHTPNEGGGTFDVSGEKGEGIDGGIVGEVMVANLLQS